jgi:hypothetical protein
MLVLTVSSDFAVIFIDNKINECLVYQHASSHPIYTASRNNIPVESHEIWLGDQICHTLILHRLHRNDDKFNHKT